MYYITLTHQFQLSVERTNQNTVAKYRPCSSTFLGIVHFAHCQKLLTGRGFLSGTVLQAKIQNTEQEKTEIE